MRKDTDNLQLTLPQMCQGVKLLQASKSSKHPTDTLTAETSMTIAQLRANVDQALSHV